MAYQKRGRGQWYSDFRAPNLDNPQSRRRYRLPLGMHPTKRAAEEEERRLQADIEAKACCLPANEPVATASGMEAQRTTAAFSGFARVWLDTYVKLHLRPSTAVRHEKTLRCWIVPYFKDRLLHTIRRMDVQLFLAYCVSQCGKQTGKRLSPKTINEHLSCLSSLFSQAVAWGYLEANPCEGVKRMELEPEEWDHYTAEETEIWLNTCKVAEPSWWWRCHPNWPRRFGAANTFARLSSSAMTMAKD